MGIYSTSDIDDENEYRKIIRDRIDKNLESMSKPRLTEVLEALVQIRDYDDYHDDDFAYNNFWSS